MADTNLPSALDQTDLRLLHALQVDPRASWNELAPVVGVDAATLARRWARLDAEGLAWVTGYDSSGQLALLEIECELARLEQVAAEMGRDRQVLVLDFSSGGRDLLALVMGRDLAEISAYAVGRLGAIEGVRAVRTHIANEILTDGSSWRLRTLKPAEVARIRPPKPPRPRAARRVDDGLRAALEDELWRDGRASIADIAQRTGYAPQRVSDAIATLRSTGDLVFRTDIARAASGWPIYTWYFVEAPARIIEAARAAIATVPEVRLAFTASSRYNLILAVWLRRIADVNRFEMALEQALQGSRIADRAVVLRIAKHMNRIVGPDTRAIGSANSEPAHLKPDG
ncbi:Lrp/AsnC family transcriptional regulator [Arthrobacter ginkgonis]|uniref:Lrp/AsnC family transcriptional regulator n=1 Tax=Arthrobacter ginkgonis TaxID=1630594 RepID=A0ABP7CR96_9MICC